MSIEHSRKTYEKLGREDPFYAVLTAEKFRNNKWDPRAFFETGEREIEEMLSYVRSLNEPFVAGRVLDFGCGVGRLSQALGDHFASVVGIDIAESMVERARELNRHGDKVEYIANAVEHLGVIPDGSIDFVYSSISLQHVPPDANRQYVEEFFRVLKPGGMAVFQVPNGKAFRRNSWSERWYRFRRQTVRRLWKQLRGKPPYEMHYIPRAEVEEMVQRAGARLVDVRSVGTPGRYGNFRYCVVR